MEIAAGSEREERGIRGLHHGRRMRPAPWLVEDKWGSSLSWHTASPMGLSTCLLRLLPGTAKEVRGYKRIASRKVDVTSHMAGRREVG